MDLTNKSIKLKKDYCYCSATFDAMKSDLTNQISEVYLPTVSEQVMSNASEFSKQMYQVKWTNALKISIRCKYIEKDGFSLLTSYK